MNILCPLIYRLYNCFVAILWLTTLNDEKKIQTLVHLHACVGKRKAATAYFLRKFIAFENKCVTFANKLSIFANERSIFANLRKYFAN